MVLGDVGEGEVVTNARYDWQQYTVTIKLKGPLPEPFKRAIVREKKWHKKWLREMNKALFIK